MAVLAKVRRSKASAAQSAAARRSVSAEFPLGAAHNADIAAAFEEIADLLEIENANAFRVRAYRNAARVVGGLPNEAAAMLARGEDLTELPGIGKDLAGKIAELVKTGGSAVLADLHKHAPQGLVELLRLPGLGPKKVKALHDKLQIETVSQLHRALQDGRVRDLAGFGAQTEKRLLQALEAKSASGGRMKLAVAAQYAEPLAEYLRKSPGVGQVAVAGSYRRARDTVGDIDIVATAKDAATVMERFVSYPETARVLSRGPTRSTIVLRSGIQVDLRVVAPESYGAALVYFTGSKAHNIAIRRIAQGRGLKINEYGVFSGKRRLSGETEDSVYQSIRLPTIPPELREDRGEIEAAKAKSLPDLIELKDLRGDLHAHTTATDGRNSLQEMALAAKARGYEYVAITEHSRHLTIAHGLDPARLARQIGQIDAFNRQKRGIRILKGIEVDILDDGQLDLPDTILSRLDLVVAAVHSKFNLSRAQQTERVLRGLDNPYVTILAHPSGRLIGRREPYDIDMPRLLKRCQERGCFIELNAHPDRLDLLDTHCRMAKELGVLVSINTDAHSTSDFDNMRFGVGQARRGWLGRDDVLNTRPLARLLELLARARRS
ncbi:DNA polymerase/3'-5' exonuclease PolX [Dongia sedimenti]|uniref:DNA polymerase beta n=1 Tax=Dongia sedimenti TaxID=3064282 RepID=A0ABU0YRZ6_9PROT|nr:DNA polymerase/3'-5' exonuclease PolX [Rhodospirillaceae bacterium R-7]